MYIKVERIANRISPLVIINQKKLKQVYEQALNDMQYYEFLATKHSED